MSENKPDLMAELAADDRYAVAECFDKCRFGNFEVIDTSTQDRVAQCITRDDADTVANALNLRAFHTQLEAVIRKAQRYDLMTSRFYDETGRAMHNSAREG